MIVTIDGTGRLVIPKEVREQFSLSAGTRLELVTTGDHLELIPPQEPEAELVEHDGWLMIDGPEPALSTDEILALRDGLRR